MKIVIDARIVNSSTGRYVERLLYHLQSVDVLNDYIILVPTKDKDYFKPKNKNFQVLTIDFPNYSLKEQFAFKKFLDSLSPDLVHFCMPQQPIFYSGKTVTTFHDLTLLKTYNSDKNWIVFHIKQHIGKFVFKRVARSSDHILTPTEYVKQDLIEFADISPSKVTVTYEAADVNPGKPQKVDLPFKEYILYVGQQSDYKNIKRLGDAHQKLREKYPDLGLVLVGSKNASALKNESYFKKHGYKNIVYTGFASDPELEWLYRNCRAYIFPSLMEGFGLPGLEAMGYGAPVVSSSATCLPEVYADAAFYFDPRSTDDIARAINEVLSNKQLRDSMIIKGYEQSKKYSWRHMAEQTHTIYERVLG